MNEANLAYLQFTLLELGFSAQLNKALEQVISTQPPSFLLGEACYFEPPVRLGADKKGKDFVRFIFNFSKAQGTDIYRLHNFLAELTTHNGIQRRQGFEFDRLNKLNAVEAYHLLLGSAIQKTVFKRTKSPEDPIKKAEVWFKLKLDKTGWFGMYPLSKFYPSQGFNLTGVLDKYPFIYHREGQKEELVAGIRKGSLPGIDLLLDGNIERAFIAANPKRKALDVYDRNMNLIGNELIFQRDGMAQTPQGLELPHHPLYPTPNVYSVADNSGSNEEEELGTKFFRKR